MKNKQSGFVGTAVIFVITILAVGGGVYSYSKMKQQQLPRFAMEDTLSIDENYSSTTTRVSVKNKAIIVTPDVPVLQKDYDLNKRVQYMTQGVSLMAAISEARYQTEMQADYSTVCNSVESWIVKKYNNGGVDDIGVKLYSPVVKINGLVCVSNKEKYAFSVPIIQKNGSVIATCVDSTGFFKDGSVNKNTFSCSTK